MKLNHINLTVTDAQGARQLLEKHFGLISMDGTADDATFLAMRDDEGLVLTLMESNDQAVVYPSTFHIGFLVGNEARVIEIYEALKNDGYNVPEPAMHRGRSLDLYFATPFGFTIQVS